MASEEATRIIDLYQRKALDWVESRAGANLFEKLGSTGFGRCCRLLRRSSISGADPRSQWPAI